VLAKLILLSPRQRFALLEADMPSAHLPAMSAAPNMPPHMTVAEFLEWEPPGDTGALWQLHDGEPEMLAPASDPHGSIQTELAYLVTTHLRATSRASSPANARRTTAWSPISALPARRRRART
jgi:hypothetical protein